MSTSLKRKHEGLANYLHPIGAPGTVTVGGGLQPRQAVAPGGAIPGGFRPIPTSSQRPKPTNATIVYSRTAVADTRKLGRIGKFFKEGDLVFTQRIAPPLKDPMGQNVKVTSMQLLNQDLKDAGPMDAEEYKKFFESKDGAFKWSPDGVVNNLDGADPENEFKDFAIANVAIQGFVRFSTLPFGDETRGHNFPHLFTQKGARNGDRVYLALTDSSAIETLRKKTYRFEFFLASHVTTGKIDLSSVIKCWRIGRVVDGNQSKNMVTLCVDVESVATESVQRAWGRA
tara:strand:- start:22 stop:876 length:855 start_codon:yes stop_codon:yes gene_type:complete